MDSLIGKEVKSGKLCLTMKTASSSKFFYNINDKTSINWRTNCATL